MYGFTTYIEDRVKGSKYLAENYPKLINTMDKDKTWGWYSTKYVYIEYDTELFLSFYKQRYVLQ